MADSLKLMCIFAHPDDESLGTGGTLAKYSAEGVQTYLVTATRGERGWAGDEESYPGPEALGKTREAELRAAAVALGVREVNFLDYIDGEVDQANPAEAISKIVGHLRRVKPQVVVTFPPDGAYGHPDHIAISQFTAGALVCAADSNYADPNGLQPHVVSKFYYRVSTKDEFAVYQATFPDLVMRVDGVDRRAVGWEDWTVTTRIDTAAYWRMAWQAVTCHQTQLPQYRVLEKLSEADHRRLWGSDGYYRVFSLVNGGRKVEVDLFEGLR